MEATPPIRRGDRGRGPRPPLQIFAATWKSAVKVKPTGRMDGREWAASRFAGNVRFERRTTTGTEPRHPQAASFYFRDPAAFRLALTFSFAFSKQKRRIRTVIAQRSRVESHLLRLILPSNAIRII